MSAQGRQQLRLKRLELVQQLDEVAFEFDGTREKTIKVQEWMAKHQSVCALLLRKKMLERQIVSLDSNVDELVYELYELSEKEINFVESAMKSME